MTKLFKISQEGLGLEILLGFCFLLNGHGQEHAMNTSPVLSYLMARLLSRAVSQRNDTTLTKTLAVRQEAMHFEQGGC